VDAPRARVVGALSIDSELADETRARVVQAGPAHTYGDANTCARAGVMSREQTQHFTMEYTGVA
jgi:hypothetical protein